MNIFEKYPRKEELLNWYKTVGISKTLKVNNHIHSPFSFSAFENIPQAVSLAVDEKVKILGINDFFVCDGYEEFSNECYKQKVFPVFNIEFIGLSKQDQKNNIKVNDPNNPGRTYFSGKGLKFPKSISKENEAKLESVIQESQKQVSDMIHKLNDHIASLGFDLKVSMDEIFSQFAKNLVRERHIAKALRIKVVESFSSESEQINFFTKLYENQEPKIRPDNIAAFENEIRGKLLKQGGIAFVPEDERAFLEVAELKDIIIDMGGIPTYPLLLDDSNGNFTDFEASKEDLLEELLDRGVYSIELIPNRNSFTHLKEYVEYFYNQGFIVTFGTEHNTPELTKLTVDCRGNVELDDELKIIAFNGAAVLAAHQYLHFLGEEGYINSSGEANIDDRSYFEILGKAIINYYFTVLN